MVSNLHENSRSFSSKSKDLQILNLVIFRSYKPKETLMALQKVDQQKVFLKRFRTNTVSREASRVELMAKPSRKQVQSKDRKVLSKSVLQNSPAKEETKKMGQSKTPKLDPLPEKAKKSKKLFQLKSRKATKTV